MVRSREQFGLVRKQIVGALLVTLRDGKATMEKAEYLATAIFFIIQVIVKAGLELGEGELGYNSPTKGRAMCRVLYIGPDLCITAFSLFTAVTLTTLQHPPVGTQAIDLAPNFLTTLAVIVILLLITLITWHSVPAKAVPVRQEPIKADQGEIMIWNCVWIDTPPRVIFLLVSGLLLGCAALGAVWWLISSTQH